MKFEKVLIALYSLLQILLAASLYMYDALTPHYAVFTALTLLFFALTHFRDPGYIIVDETNQIPDVSDQLEQDEHTVGLNKDQRRKTRYCRICMINQPFRTKHCHECERCVVTFDHHCPWMATCIGEKNRPLFLLYLYAQVLQAFCASLSICSVAVNQMSPIPSQLALGITLILVLSVVLGLAIFQTYLMMGNLTTWELAKWDKIEYLNKHSRKSGSPFSKGVAKNCMEYWESGFRKSRKIWEFESE